MDPVRSARARLARLPAHLARCPAEAAAYARCVTSSMAAVEHGQCQEEFEALKRCVAEAAKKAGGKRLASADKGGGSKVTARQKELMARGLPKKRMLEGVDRVILVASGKGGVGKSTLSANLALALTRHEKTPLNVGLLDADVYGPSAPIILGLTKADKPEVSQENGKMLPLSAYGLKVMSMGFLTSKSSSAVVWRGPMVMGAVEKMAHGTDWGQLDVLIVDLPPGTGDIHLSMTQTTQVAGAVVVTTPQKVALADARKAADMFEKVGIPIYGVVENMNAFKCPQCGETSKIFGSEGGEKLAKELKVPLLGSIPLDPDVMLHADEGKPLCISKPDSSITKSFYLIADSILKVSSLV